MRSFFCLVMMAAPIPVFAACNPPDILQAPGSEVQAIVNFENDNPSFGVSERSHPFPRYLTAQQIASAGRNVAQNERNTITYFEPDAQGRWRICREEKWSPKVAGDEAKAGARYRASHPVAAELSKRQMQLATVDTYHYDAKGRIARVGTNLLIGKQASSWTANCLRFDQEDRLLLIVTKPKSGTCPEGEPSPQDMWRQFRYETASGKTEVLLDRSHTPDEQGGWSEVWSLKLGTQPDALRASEVRIDSRYGVRRIDKSNFGPRDRNSANTALDGNGRSPLVDYVFTKPGTPMSVLENPERIYQYDRRRESRFDHLSGLLEWFPAGSHLSRHRYFMLGPVVTRHEQFDEQGKIKRIVTVLDEQPPGSWNAAPLPKAASKPIGRKIFHRVYEFDAAGKPKLVAVSWNRNISLRNVTLADADLVYGTPDGKERWKNIFEFNEAFDTSDNGHHVFKEPADATGD